MDLGPPILQKKNIKNCSFLENMVIGLRGSPLKVSLQVKESGGNPETEGIHAITTTKTLNGGFHKWGVPQNFWFITENPNLKWMMTGGTPISGNLQDPFVRTKPQRGSSSPTRPSQRPSDRLPLWNPRTRRRFWWRKSPEKSAMCLKFNAINI